MVAFRRGVKMQRLWPLFLFVVIFVIAVANNNSDTENEQLPTGHPQRIISLSPNITEIIFDLSYLDDINDDKMNRTSYST